MSSNYKKIIKHNNNTIYFYNYTHTLKQIIDGGSFIRFGDGEYQLMIGNNISFQKYDESFKFKFENILKNSNHGKKYMIGLYLKRNYNKKWNEYNDNIINIFNKNKDIYIYDALIFRNSIYHKDVFINFFKYLKNKNIAVIHHSINGFEYFKNIANTFKFIKCLSKNNYDQYSFLLEQCSKLDKKYIILLSCGPCGKILAYSLIKLGYQIIDIGAGYKNLGASYYKIKNKLDL
jgi:hypothetical protein